VSATEWLVPASRQQAPLRLHVLAGLLLGGATVIGGAHALTRSFAVTAVLAFVGWFVYGNVARLEARAMPERGRSRWSVRPLWWTIVSALLALAIFLTGWLVIGQFGDGAAGMWLFAGFVLACECPEQLLFLVRRQRSTAET
jgi:hypothetical protein